MLGYAPGMADHDKQVLGLRLIMQGVEQAMNAEGVGVLTIRRVMNRLMYGDPMPVDRRPITEVQVNGETIPLPQTSGNPVDFR